MYSLKLYMLKHLCWVCRLRAFFNSKYSLSNKVHHSQRRIWGLIMQLQQLVEGFTPFITRPQYSRGQITKESYDLS